MSLVRFFSDVSARFLPEINEALKRIKDFLGIIEAYKARAGEPKYQHINEKLWNERFKNESIDTKLNILSDVTHKYALLNASLTDIKQRTPVMVYANSLHKTLRHLKEDVDIYRKAINSLEEKETLEKKLTTDELETLEKENLFCEELKKLIELIEADFSELEHVKNVLDPIDVVIEETNSTTNKI